MNATKINQADLSTEAAIWAEGTEYSKQDLIRLYNEHVAECEASGTEPKYCQRFFSENLTIANETSNALTVVLGHRSSIQGARWCKPVGFEPTNEIEGAEFVDGSWWGDESEEAGLVCFAEGAEGDEIEVSRDDLRVASCGDCRVIGEVEIG